VASAGLPVRGIPIEWIGRCSHPLEQIAQGSNPNTKSEVLGHPRGHGVIGQVFLAKFLKEICVLLSQLQVRGIAPKISRRVDARKADDGKLGRTLVRDETTYKL
jgi:hypothetical protein